MNMNCRKSRNWSAWQKQLWPAPKACVNLLGPLKVIVMDRQQQQHSCISTEMLISKSYSCLTEIWNWCFMSCRHAWSVSRDKPANVPIMNVKGNRPSARVLPLANIWMGVLMGSDVNSTSSKCTWWNKMADNVARGGFILFIEKHYNN